MKILLYAEPTTIIETPYPQSDVIKNHLYTWVAKNLLVVPNVEVKIVVPEIVYIQNTLFNHITNVDLVEFKDEYLLDIFSNSLSIQEMFLKIFNNELLEDEYKKFNNIIKNILPDFKPDIVIDFQIHNQLLRYAYPNALHMLVENGLFSRPPFPRTLRYEPIHFLNGFLNKYENEIRNFHITNEQKKLVQNFKQNLRTVINANNKKGDILKELKMKYRYLLLCPIPADNLYKETKYNDQYLYLLDILNKIPSDIGLIITFHDDCSSQLSAGIVKTLQEKYKNLIYFPVEDNAYVSQSLDFFEYCDAIINMHTMTGTQAMLWDLKVISMDKRYSKWFCDKQGLDNIVEFLSEPTKDKSNMIYWYMTHFCVFEHSMQKPNWYYNYFKNKLESYRQKGISFDLFEQVEDFDNIAEYIIDYVKNYYIKTNIKPEINTIQEIPLPEPTFLQQIFSVKNEEVHKVIRILGFKIKFKRKLKTKTINS